MVFTDDQNGADTVDRVYTVDATKHYIADLPANILITVKRGGVVISGSPFDTGSAGVIAFSATSGEATYTIGDAPIDPPTSTGGITNTTGGAISFNTGGTVSLGVIQ